MSEKHLSGFENDELVDELKERGYIVGSADDPADLKEQVKKADFYVSEDDPDERVCEVCQERDDPNITLEAIHYLLAGNKIPEAVEKMRAFIYDQIGRSS